MTDHITKIREAISAWDANATSKRATSGGNEAVIEYMKRAAAWEAFLSDHFKVEEARSLLAALDEAQMDALRLDWLLWRLPGDAIRYCVGDLSDTSNGDEFRSAIDAVIAAQEGSQDA